MSTPTMEQLQSELTEIFLDAPAALHGNTRLAVPSRPRALNATQHGLSGQQVLLGASEILHYAQMGIEYMRDLKPVGPLETGAAQLYFEDRWRLHRILSVENDLFYIDRPQPGSKSDNAQPVMRKPGFERQVNAFREEARNIDLISRYETRLVRNSGRLMDEIRALRNERATTDPDLVYDEQTDPAAVWYRSLLAKAQRIAEAREQHAGPCDHEAALTLKDGSKIAAQNAEAVESIASSETSFGKKARRASTDSPETASHWNENPGPDCNRYSSRRAVAA